MKTVSILLLTILCHFAFGQKCIDIQLVHSVDYSNTQGDKVIHISTNENGDFELKTGSSFSLSAHDKLVLISDELNFSEYYHIEVKKGINTQKLEFNTVYPSCESSNQINLMIENRNIQSLNLIIE